MDSAATKPAERFGNGGARWRLWLQIAHTSGAGAFGILVSAAGLAITARYLGPEGRGIYAAANAWVALFATLGSLSLGQVVIHHVAGRPREEWLPDVLGTLLAIVAVIVVLAWGVVWSGYVAWPGELFANLSPGLLALAFAALPFLIGIELSRYLLTALDELYVANWAQMIGATVGLVTVIVLVVLLGLGVPGALWGSVLAAAVWAGICSVALLRRAAGVRASPVLARQLLRGSSRLHLNAIGNYLLAQASVLVLNHYRPPAETGYYQLAMQLFGLALIVPTSISTVAFGQVGRQGADGAWPEQRRLIVQSLIAVCVIAVVGYFLAPFGIRLLAGEEFLPAVPLFRLLLPALLGATFSTVMASQWIGRGLFLQAALLTLAVGSVGLGVSFVLIPSQGMYGALWSTLVSYGASVVVNTAMAVWVQRQWRVAQGRETHRRTG